MRTIAALIIAASAAMTAMAEPITLREAMQESGLEFTEEEGEAAFYGPKADFFALDALGLLPVVIEAPPVGELPVGVIEEKIGRARRPVGARDRLCFIVEVGERVILISRTLRHLFRRVVRKAGGVVGADGDEVSASREAARQRDDALLDRLRVGAVVASEDDHQRFRVEIGQRPHTAAGGLWQREVGRTGAERWHR